MKYELFFFKENTRNIDIEEVIKFFTTYPEISIISNDDFVEIKYQNIKLAFDASFYFTKVSKVPDIYRLDPKYLDLDIYLSVDTLLPMFKFEKIVDIVEGLCKKFDFFIYQVLFENVSPFKKDLLIKSYDIIRNAYRNKYPMEYVALIPVDKKKLDVAFRYISECDEIANYYKDKAYVFPNIYFVKNKNTMTVNIACEYQKDTNFVFPPCIDYLVIKENDDFKIIDYQNICPDIQKYTLDVPGFIPNTKVLDYNSNKKVNRIIYSKKIKAINDDIINIDIESLIDF